MEKSKFDTIMELLDQLERQLDNEQELAEAYDYVITLRNAIIRKAVPQRDRSLRRANGSRRIS